MKVKAIEGYKFLQILDDKFEVYFSTAENDLNFKIDTEEGNHNIQKIKTWFNVEDVGYLNQIHSSIVLQYDGKVHKGDAIISNKKNIALGIFTADCVPVLLYDKVKGVYGAVHSGWKGTLLGISAKAVNDMKSKFKSLPQDITAIIGPHNMACCYEFGINEADEFKKLPLYKNEEIYVDNKLNLLKCIEIQLRNVGVNEITTLNTCTYCNKEFKLHSYRRDKVKSGRMFSFIILR